MGFSTTASSVILAAVSFIEPAASPSYVQVVATPSYIQPCVRTSYLQVKVCAEVTFPDVLAVEIITPADQIYLDVSKPVADSLNRPTDALTLRAQKNIADSVSVAESIETTLIYVRTFSENIFAADTQALAVDKLKTDAVVIGEDSVYDLSKPLTDIVSMVDNMDANIQHSFIKTLSEFTTNTDAQVIDFKPNKADNVATGSSGYLLMQDYCDITYFLEDYVGSYRTFT